MLSILTITRYAYRFRFLLLLVFIVVSAAIVSARLKAAKRFENLDSGTVPSVAQDSRARS